ncbi:hypothetical protein B6N60_02632 [Richelia sinica FACHB-800]|uniref:Uncharacterized protein n=1 Tax=Richelia sinica FACHB-800 TaxID=1357546 RepID=A0A975T8M5_9NOST|nr:hypothetical protein B6N60_02632 [Richelia sinica FACHB-800]
MDYLLTALSIAISSIVSNLTFFITSKTQSDTIII